MAWPSIMCFGKPLLNTVLCESRIRQYNILSALVTPESGFCYTTSDIRKAVDTFWPQFWNLWLCGGEVRLQQLLISSWPARSTSYSVAPSHREGIIGREGSQDNAVFGAQDSAPEFIISFVYNAVFVTGEACFHTYGGYSEWKNTYLSNVFMNKVCSQLKVLVFNIVF
jgi:hypothetical protein